MEVRENAVDNVLPKYSHHKLVGIMLDERKDRDPVNSSHRVEHCSVVLVYDDGTEVHVGHYCPQPDAKTGKYTGKMLAQGLYDFCLDRKIPTEDLKFIGSDGTPKMTGHKTGAQAEFEKLLKRPLQRLGCMFHHLEKSFGHIIELYGLDTTSGTTLLEPWKSLLSGDVHLAEVNPNFGRMNSKAVEEALSNLTDEVFKDLSTDHKILISIIHYIQTGEDKYKQIKRKIGPISMARFTTLETRVLRAYLSSFSPPPYLVRMVNFLFQVWVPVYLNTKIYSKRFMGPKLVFMELQLGKEYLNDEEFKVLEASLDSNGLNMHQENILLCLLNSKDRSERETAVQVIRDIRSGQRPRSKSSLPPRRSADQVRVYAPEDYVVNTEAESLIDLNCQDANTEPPFTMSLSDIELEEIISQPLQTRLPVSTVSVERAVKDVTRASGIVRVSSRQIDGLILNSQNARDSERERNRERKAKKQKT